MDVSKDTLSALGQYGVYGEPVIGFTSQVNCSAGECSITSSDSIPEDYHIKSKHPQLLNDQTIHLLPRDSLPPNNDLELTRYNFATPAQLGREILPAVRRSPSSQALDLSEHRLEPVSLLGRCTLCRMRRKKCDFVEASNDPRCVQCITGRFPASICTRAPITQYKPFEKWKNMIYESLFTAVQKQSGIATKVELQHYYAGPVLTVICCEFSPIYSHQVRALKKDSLGWHSTPTTAYCITEFTTSVAAYVHACVPYAMNEVCESANPMSVFFRMARVHQDIPIIWDCLELLTCLRLLFIGWQFHGQETLGMEMMGDPQSAWYGQIPVPRMVQNQLGHQLELRMIELDHKILSALHKMFNKLDRSLWVVVTLTVFILLHVRELDGARNIFWKRYKDVGGFWIHPAKPASLIEEEILSCGSLLSHYYCLMSKSPLSMNWDLQKTKDLANNDERVIMSMKVLQSYIPHLREMGMIGRRASDVYEDGKPESAQLTISSLMFESVERGCKIEGFS